MKESQVPQGLAVSSSMKESQVPQGLAVSGWQLAIVNYRSLCYGSSKIRTDSRSPSAVTYKDLSTLTNSHVNSCFRWKNSMRLSNTVFRVTVAEKWERNRDLRQRLPIRTVQRWRILTLTVKKTHFLIYRYVLSHAWLNLCSEHITAGGINQVNERLHPSSRVFSKLLQNQSFLRLFDRNATFMHSSRVSSKLLKHRSFLRLFNRKATFMHTSRVLSKLLKLRSFLRLFNRNATFMHTSRVLSKLFKHRSFLRLFDRNATFTHSSRFLQASRNSGHFTNRDKMLIVWERKELFDVSNIERLH